MEHLGHILTTEEVKRNANKVKAIQKIKQPEIAKQIKSFLRATSYYRKLIKHYAEITYPMRKYHKRDVIINKNDRMYIDSFYKVKRQVVNLPILKYPDFNNKCKITTDASDQEIGRVLIQDEHPICYAKDH